MTRVQSIVKVEKAEDSVKIFKDEALVVEIDLKANTISLRELYDKFNFNADTEYVSNDEQIKDETGDLERLYNNTLLFVKDLIKEVNAIGEKKEEAQKEDESQEAISEEFDATNEEEIEELFSR